LSQQNFWLHILLHEMLQKSKTWCCDKYFLL
jgi:hypothetical protein